MTHTASPSTLPSQADIEARYKRAEFLMQGLRTQTVVQNDSISPHWIAGSDCFWYIRYHKAEGYNAIHSSYRLVDAKATTNEPAFDHQALATALSDQSTETVQADALPISDVQITLSPGTVAFTAFNQRWQFDKQTQQCKLIDSSPVGECEALSPDGKNIAFVRDYNLWVRDTATGDERALTDDGEPYFCYAAAASAYGVAWAYPGLVGALWSPDSQRLFVMQRDTRHVKTLPMVDHVPQDGSLRPRLESIKVAYPGDEHIETYRAVIIDLATETVQPIDYPPIAVGNSDQGFFTVSKLGWWANNSRHAYFIEQPRGDQRVRLVECDSRSGATRVLFEEQSDTHINIRPEEMNFPLHHYLADTQELIWWSERSGWGQLYLYDLNSGELKNRITEGEWRVRDIIHVDPQRRELWIQTACRLPGRNPYYRDICRVSFDGGELTALTHDDNEYAVATPTVFPGGDATGVAPNGDYIVATASRVDTVPVSQLLNRKGDPLLTLETADISGLPSDWQWPESVSVMAADQRTELCGVLFRPSGFDPDKRYPVINMVVGGPWLSAVSKGSFHNSRGYADRYYFQGAALAELGFIVLVLDSRGGPLRDKAFQDACYGWIPDSANTDDHRAALTQLAQRYPEMDLNRVGLYSPTGYAGGLQNLMECPDLYRVGVVNSHQDSRLINCTVEADKYHGLAGPKPTARFPEQLVDTWNGKLFLMHTFYGALESCYPPASTFRMIDALRKANKDFDLLMVPHPAGFAAGSYEIRRCWDYLVQHLQGNEPPKEFSLGEFQW